MQCPVAEQLAGAMVQLGYRSLMRQTDLRKGAVLEASNCVYHAVAKKQHELCAFDVSFLTAASGGLDVQLETCIARGDSVCRFCIRKRSSPAT